MPDNILRLQSFVVGFFKALAFSRSTRRNNFPLGFLGIVVTISTPPASRL